MSVLIHMDMPKNCGVCELCGCYTESKGEVHRCDISMYVIKDLERLLDDCPLVEVPEPHGRLIDADALLSLDRQIYDGEIAVGRREYIFCFEVEDAPTVIEAEEGE